MSEAKFNYSGKLAYLTRACRDRRLLRTDLAVLSVLADRANMNSCKCWPSINRISHESGVPRTTTIKAIKRLEVSEWITTERTAGANSTYYLKMPDDAGSAVDGTSATWNVNGSASGLLTGPVHGTDPVPPTVSEQEEDINQKKNKTDKSGAAIALFPTWLSPKHWQDFLEYRQEIKKPMTLKAQSLAIEKLKELRVKGNDPTDVINQSILNGWVGLFEIKAGTRNPEPPQLPRETEENIRAVRIEAERHLEKWNQ